MNELILILSRGINKIDDYFEYSNESAKDKAVVMGIIDNMNNNLRTYSEQIKNEKNSEV